MKLSDYIAVLKANILDTSDVILLSTEILYQIPALDTELKSRLNSILVAYLNQDYALALQTLEAIYNKLPEHYQTITPWVHKHIKSDTLIRKDLPTRNESRRFFESKLAHSAWLQLNVNHFCSLNKLAIYMASRNEKYHYLPQNVSIHDEAEKIVRSIRDYVDETKIYSDVGSVVRLYKNSLSMLKDRGKKKTDGTLSMHQGIIKSTSPTPRDFYLSQARTNSVTDSFEINPNVTNGFSANKKFTPFVNSVSGTTYDLAILLLQYIEDNKEDKNLQQDINNIVLAFLLFSCKEGYHNFYEMLAVLTEDNMIDFLFKLNRITVGSYVLEPYLEAPYRMAAVYALVINARKIMHADLTKQVLTAPNLPKAVLTSIQLVVRLHLEITINARTGDPQPFLGAVITDIIPQGDTTFRSISLSESNGTTELFEFLKPHLPDFFITQHDKQIRLNDVLEAAKNPVSGRSEIVKIPLVNAFNFRDQNDKLLKCNDIRFIRMLAKLCELEGRSFTLTVSLNKFNLPTRATLFSNEGIGMSAATGSISSIKLENMAGDADSKLSLLIEPSQLQPITTLFNDILGKYQGWATPIGPAAPYFTVAQAFVDRDLQNMFTNMPKDKQKMSCF